MRQRSPKRAKIYRDERVPLVAAFLEERPVCECCRAARSVDVHELLSRARGGSILDEENLVALCRVCHDLITGNPTLAEEHGWARPSGQQADEPNARTPLR